MAAESKTRNATRRSTTATAAARKTLEAQPASLLKAFQAPAWGDLLNDERSMYMAKLGVMGMVGAAVYAFMRYESKRAINPAYTLKVRTDAVAGNPKILHALLKLQRFRKLDKDLFQNMTQKIDLLLFLEQEILRGNVVAKRKDFLRATTLFRKASNRMSEYLWLIRDDLGNEYASIAYQEINTIYQELLLHLTNIHEFSFKFSPSKLMQSVEKEVHDVLRAYKRQDRKRSRIADESHRGTRELLRELQNDLHS